MTQAQKARLQGWNASVKVRGVSVSIYPDGPSFTALVQPVNPESEQHPLSKEVRNYSIVCFLRSDVVSSGANIGIGAVLVNDETQETYRVAKIEDNGQDIKVAYHCETSIIAIPETPTDFAGNIPGEDTTIVTWAAADDPALDFVIKGGTVSGGPYPHLFVAAKTVRTLTFDNGFLGSGDTGYFIIVARSSIQTESEPSDEIAILQT